MHLQYAQQCTPPIFSATLHACNTLQCFSAALPHVVLLSFVLTNDWFVCIAYAQRSLLQLCVTRPARVSPPSLGFSFTLQQTHDPHLTTSNCASIFLYGSPFAVPKPQGKSLSLPPPKWGCLTCMNVDGRSRESLGLPAMQLARVITLA